MLLRMAGVLCLLYVPAVIGANLVTNGGFETTDFTGWFVTGSGATVQCGNGSYPAHTGSCAADFGAFSAGLSQTIATIPGAFYSLDFWLALTGGGAFDPHPSFSASWDGTTFLFL